MTTIAITGTSGFLGNLLLAALARRRHVQLLAIDRLPPAISAPQVRFIPCDLTSPQADDLLATALRDARCDTVFHGALHSQPKRDQEYSHELQSIGTMYLLHALAAANVRKLVVCTTTDAYGAYPSNPSLLTESHPLRGGKLSDFLRDKVDVESWSRQIGQVDK